jgi:WD40 repeat protein
MCVAFSPDGKQLLTGSNDRTLRLWDVATRKMVRRWDHPDGGRTVAFFKDGRRFIVGGDGCRTVRVYDVDKESPTVETKPVASGITCVALSPDEKHILSASHEVILWDAATGDWLGRMPLDPGEIWTIAVSPTERLALSGAGDGQPRLWDIDKRELVRKFGKHDAVVRSATFLPDGKRALTTSFDGTLRLWEVATGKQLDKFEPNDGWLNQVVVSRDGRFAVTAGHHSCRARVWDLDKRQLVATWRHGHGGAVEGAAISPDGRLAATCARDGTVRLWRMPQP